MQIKYFKPGAKFTTHEPLWVCTIILDINLIPQPKGVTLGATYTTQELLWVSFAIWDRS